MALARTDGLQLTGARGVRVLVFNAGSSSLKARVLDLARDPANVPSLVASATVEPGSDASRGRDIGLELPQVIASLAKGGLAEASLDVVAHRIVHGGTSFTAPVVVDGAVLAALDALAPLAPLHNPVAVSVIRAAQAVLPGPPHVAVFDTAFHATLPEVGWRYPVPDRWTDAFGVRRFGFHGLSVAWSVERAAQLLGRAPAEIGLVVAHLGNGCSVTAVHQGRSVATSMGMTPLEGLMMGTRAGSIDPGIVIRLLRAGDLDLDALVDDLEHRSGLLGVSGVTGDVRHLTEAAAAGDERSRLALAMFADRAAAGIAAVATALPRLDAIAFTGGIGEHAGVTRSAIVERLGVLGIGRIPTDETGVDRILPDDGSRGSGGVVVLRIESREDIVAARAAARTIG